MAKQKRTESQKAINDSLTPPEEDLKHKGSDYPEPHKPDEQVPVDSGGPHPQPTYGAGPGADINPEVDPNAPPIHRMTKTSPNSGPERGPSGSHTSPPMQADASKARPDDTLLYGRATPRPGPEQFDTKGPQVQQEPRPPLPAQHQGKPGMEYEVHPRPQYMAPLYKAAGKLQGKAALITGGDSGIGRAVAVLYAREGADVAIVFLPNELTDAEETQRAVEAAGRKCVLIPGDLTDPNFCRECVECVVREFGHLEILVSNAAWQNRKDDITQVSEDEFDTTFKTNIYAYFHLVKAAVPHMKPGSAIIATSSETGLFGNKSLPDYSATKGAINAFTKAIAQQLIKKGIRVNAVAPGPVWTSLNPNDLGESPEQIAKFGQDTPMGRPAQPEEIAPAYVFLASDADSSYVTGIVLEELGGETGSA